MCGNGNECRGGGSHRQRLNAQDPPEGGSFLLKRASVADVGAMQVGPEHPSPARVIVARIVPWEDSDPEATKSSVEAANHSTVKTAKAAAGETTTTVETATSMPCGSTAVHSTGD